MICRKIMHAVLLCLIFLLCIGCIDDNTAPKTDAVDKDSTMYAYSNDEYDIATANNAFAFDLYSSIAKEENLVFSPYSIFTAMAICYDGAENSTKEQIAQVFNYPLSKPVLETASKNMMDTINSDDENYDLNTANALWVRKEYPLNQEFESNSKEYYGGNVTDLDFRAEPEESRVIINEWVALKTKDKIKDLIPRNLITEDTAIIMTNAVYFQGKWMNEFDTTDTERGNFYTSSNNDGIPVDMMYIQEYFSYGENEHAMIIELPYKGNDLCMYIVLPEENNIEEFEDIFTLSDYDTLRSSMGFQLVHTYLPRFKIDTKTELPETLQDMGIIDAFDSNKANLSGMYDIQRIPEDYNLWLDDAIHQSYINVNEEGTEAAASTAIEAVDSAGWEESEQVLEFKADHPFMFFIEDKRTGCILFMGKVEYPEY